MSIRESADSLMVATTNVLIRKARTGEIEGNGRGVVLAADDLRQFALRVAPGFEWPPSGRLSMVRA
jgi:hypothetical protein